ncbi:V-type ATP synthase subunit F [Streptomyces sp. NBC_00264]|uniref:V-type ATP synthase subunit F n=1 Tax=unclassified Streptomyces TaxID=2593676 RepID=UPI00225BD27D|nr:MULTISPECIES: V-type ATP synthase subunit F [unclassified Streptomyces]MCX5165244.1 V-type ATP synthase subunit F [Streptomyces sp. NBC_00305]MCX5223767.1 V-type ATP synthase subunit F [Streptomyces sp. NBC_00264]
MGTVTAIGARTSVCGLALAGVDVLVAEEPDAVRRAWRALPGTTGLVILTAEAAEVLGPEVMAPDPSRPLTVVMPR